MSRNKSPLRYPGGKAKLYPYVSAMISRYCSKPPIYVEAFAGGFGLGIELLLNNDVSSVIINDYDYCIYSFWKCVTSQKLHKKFIYLIESTPIDIDTWNQQKEIYRHFQEHSMLEVGFATFYLNRCNRSGIINSNPIGGINQTGNYLMDCRFNRCVLISLIKNIYKQRKRIEIYNKDACKFIPWIDNKYSNVFFNFDPPYVQAGPLLYKNSFVDEDHITLSNIIYSVKNLWILTYDDNELIRSRYKSFILREYRLSYSLEKKRTGTELIIYSKRMNYPLRVHNYI